MKAYTLPSLGGGGAQSNKKSPWTGEPSGVVKYMESPRAGFQHKSQSQMYTSPFPVFTSRVSILILSDIRKVCRSVLTANSSAGAAGFSTLLTCATTAEVMAAMIRYTSTNFGIFGISDCQPDDNCCNQAFTRACAVCSLGTEVNNCKRDISAPG